MRPWESAPRQFGVISARIPRIAWTEGRVVELGEDGVNRAGFWSPDPLVTRDTCRTARTRARAVGRPGMQVLPDSYARLVPMRSAATTSHVLAMRGIAPCCQQAPTPASAGRPHARPAQGAAGAPLGRHESRDSRHPWSKGHFLSATEKRRRHMSTRRQRRFLGSNARRLTAPTRVLGPRQFSWQQSARPGRDGDRRMPRGGSSPPHGR